VVGTHCQTRLGWGMVHTESTDRSSRAATSRAVRRAERKRSRVPWLVGAALLIGLAVTFITAQIGFHKAPSGLIAGDFSAIELRVIMAWRHPLLVGPYSRFGFHHPGPMLYYVLAPVYHLVGGGVVGMLAASTTVHVCTIGATLAAAWRIGGIRIMVLLAVLLAVLAAAFWPWFANPWNPLLATTAFLLVVVASWAVAENHPAWTPIAAVSATFSIQTHIGFVGPVVAVLGGGITIAVVRALRARDVAPEVARTTFRWIGFAALVTIVLWLPAFAQQFLTDQRGNLRAIADELPKGSGFPSPIDAARAIVGALRIDGDWIVGERARAAMTGGPTTLDTGIGVPLVPIAFMVAGVYSWWAKLRTRTLFLILTLGFVAAWISLIRLRSPQFVYLYLWLPVLALLAWFAILATGVDIVTDPASDRRAKLVAAIALALGSLALTVRVLDLQVDELGMGTVVVGVLAIVAVGAVAWFRSPDRDRVGRAATSVGVAVVLGLGVFSLLRVGDAGDDPTVADTAQERKMLALADALADALPDHPGTVDLTWDGDALGLAEVTAAAVARRGADVVLPRSSQTLFGPELVGDPRPNHPQVRLQPTGAAAPEGGKRIGSWNGIVGYTIPPASP